jgi:glycyl-tRNA synthetase (class II)
MLKEPVLKKFVIVSLNKKEIGKAFKGDSKAINEIVDEWEEDSKIKAMNELQETGSVTLKSGEKEIKLSKEFISFETNEKMI